MILLKPGTVPVPPKPWWVGLKLTCPHCQAEFQLEEGDEKEGKVSLETERSPHGNSFLRVFCPTCQTLIKKTKP